MTDPDDDPLWYDRVEADEGPGFLLQLIALLFAGTVLVYGLPSRALAASLRLARALARPLARPIGDEAAARRARLRGDGRDTVVETPIAASDRGSR